MILNVFDTETTGAPEKEPFFHNPELGPEITEYALATWEDGKVLNFEHKLIMPQNWRETCTVDEADGIVRTLDGFPLSFREDTWRGRCVHWNKTDDQAMHRRLPEAMLCGSNPAFDVRMVNWELKRSGHPPLPYLRRVDTSSLGVYLYFQGLIEGTGLERLAKFFEVEHEAHTAKGDVLATIAVLENFIDLYVYKPRIYREALQEIANCSPDEGMAEFAANALKGIEQ